MLNSPIGKGPSAINVACIGVDGDTGGVVAMVVVTGLGAVSSLGATVDDLWAGLLDADHRPAHLPLSLSIDDARDQSPRAYTVGSRLEADATAGKTTTASGRSVGRATVLALEAVRQALTDAKLASGDLVDAGLTIGSALGDIDLAEAPGAERRPTELFQVSAEVAARYGLGGPNYSFSTACSAGSDAVAWSAELIEVGAAERMVVCGTEVLSRVAFATLARLGVLDREISRPFDAARRGMVPGEGSAAIVLESAASARRRGVASYAAVEASSWSCDAYHTTAPEPSGDQVFRAVSSALASASGKPGAVVLHRAGIAVSDTAEADAVARALGDRMVEVPAYSVKAAIGHTAGAAGVFACLTAVLIVANGTVPRNGNVIDVDGECGLTVPLEQPVPLSEPRVLVTATGFGGNNAVLVLGATA